MPKKAAAHIQKMAPGPPLISAVMAPTRLPVPTWAAMAVAKAWNELMPSLPAASPKSEKLPNSLRQAAPNLVTWTKPRRSEKNRPVPHRRGMRNSVPQRNPLASLTHCRSSSKNGDDMMLSILLAPSLYEIRRT